jgi:hypothetical protein
VLQNFFYPWDYRDRAVTPPAEVGTPRQFKEMVIRAECDSGLRIVLPFMAPGTTAEPGPVLSRFECTAKKSTLHYKMPITVSEAGYTSSLTLDFNDVRLGDPTLYCKFLHQLF